MTRLLEGLQIPDSTTVDESQTVLQVGERLLEDLSLPESDAAFLSASGQAVHQLGLKPGEQVLIVNGRVCLSSHHDCQLCVELISNA